MFYVANGVPSHTAFHYHPPIVLTEILLRKTQNRKSSIHASNLYIKWDFKGKSGMDFISLELLQWCNSNAE